MGAVIYPSVNSTEWQIGVSTNFGPGIVYDIGVASADLGVAAATSPFETELTKPGSPLAPFYVNR